VDTFERLGGEAFFTTLVSHFYAGVADDPVLRPMYPDALPEAERRLRLFLMQYWGGPTTYSDERGHPRLRMRHMPFRVDADARDRWLALMDEALQAAVTEHQPDDEVVQALRAYLQSAAEAMVNTWPQDQSRSVLPVVRR
jgi:hemoglobin